MIQRGDVVIRSPKLCYVGQYSVSMFIQNNMSTYTNALVVIVGIIQDARRSVHNSMKIRHVFKELLQLHAAPPDQMPNYRTEGIRRSRTYRPHLGPPMREQPTMHRRRERRRASVAGAKMHARRQTRSMQDDLAPGRVSMCCFVRGR